MKPRHCILLFLFPITLIVAGQPILLPSIGIGPLPADTDPVCPIPVQTPSITSVGRDAGETAADFTLYDLDGNPFNLHDALAIGKPVLMVSASYTCPVFRNHVASINNVVATFGDQLTTVIVYTVEAHPDQDISPYFGVVNTGAQNINAGILYRQPTNYGERKAVLQEMLMDIQIDAPIFLDGPCNEWWVYYGPQPNNAYLIDTNGVIFAHHDWYDRFPQDIVCDIDSLLGNPVPCDQSFGGNFTVDLVSNDTIYGTDAPILTAHCLLTNTSTSDVLVRVAKLNVQLPIGWSSSLCLDVCYQTSVDTAVITIPAGGTQHFYYYFYSPPSPGTGYTRVGFRNEDDNSNNFAIGLWGINSTSTSIETGREVDWGYYPNPVDDVLHINGPMRIDHLRILEISGKEVLTINGTSSFLLGSLVPGCYLAQPMVRGSSVGAPIRIMKR